MIDTRPTGTRQCGAASRAKGLAVLCCLAAGCGGAGSGGAEPTTAQGAEPALPLPEAVAVDLEPKVTARVEILTDRGRMVVGLYGEAAPLTVENFLSYVDDGFYGGKIFHRVLPAFMVQGGGFDAALERAPTRDPVHLEVIPGLEHTPGIVSMARLASDPHSATSQFFICVAQAPQLNGGYAAFGKVEEGFEVALEISNVRTHSAQTDRGAMDDVPVTPVVIQAVRRSADATR